MAIELERSILVESHAFLPRNQIKMIPTVDLLFKTVDLQLSVHSCETRAGKGPTTPPNLIRKEDSNKWLEFQVYSKYR